MYPPNSQTKLAMSPCGLRGLSSRSARREGAPMISAERAAILAARMPSARIMQGSCGGHVVREKISRRCRLRLRNDSATADAIRSRDIARASAAIRYVGSRRHTRLLRCALACPHFVRVLPAFRREHIVPLVAHHYRRRSFNRCCVMLGGLLSEALSFAPGGAVLFALAAALPSLLVLYVHCSVEAGKRRRDHSLGKLETIELERAVLLYRKAARRREEIHLEREDAGAGWRARYRSRVKFRRTFGAELEELRCYARDLRATIARLRGRPIRRFKFWIHVVSSKFALGGSLACHGLVLALLIACAYGGEPLAWTSGGDISFDTFVLWQAPEGRMLLANWMAACFGAAAMPLFYVARRLQLY